MSDSGNNFDEKKALARGLWILIFCVFGLAFVESVPVRGLLTWPFAIVAILGTSVLIHEVGHLTAALRRGFRIVSFSLGPAKIVMERGRISFRLNRDLPLGGMVVAVPKTSADLRKRMLFVALAGPIVSFSAGAIAISLAVLTVREAGLRQWILAWGAGSIVAGFISLAPQTGFYVSDGTQARMLMHATPEADAYCARLLISSAASAGIRPRDWDTALVEMAGQLNETCLDTVVGAVIGYEAAMDNGSFEQARHFLEIALAARPKCPPSLQSGLALDAAFFHATVGNDAGVARHWFQECNPKLVDDRYTILLAEAAVLLSEGKPAEACDRAAQCLVALPSARFAGFATAAEDWAQLISSRAQAKIAALATLE